MPLITGAPGSISPHSADSVDHMVKEVYVGQGGALDVISRGSDLLDIMPRRNALLDKVSRKSDRLGSASRPSVSLNDVSCESEDVFDRMLRPFNPEIEIEGEEEPAEAITPRIVRAPTKPSARDVEAHMTTHLPYRSWCPHCVRGRARGKSHPKADSSGKTLPTIALDYMFMHSAQSEGEERGMPDLVARDICHENVGTGMLFARVVPSKGANAYAIKSLASFVASLGHSAFVLKSDSEPAILALKSAVKAERAERIVLEESPHSESQSNGAAERAIQQVQGHLRTMRD